MKLSPKEREALRLKFGGRCAYCGVDLPEKGWHADHVEPVDRDWEYVHGKTTPQGYTRTRATGTCRNPHNDCRENLFPACIKCNILKSKANVEGFREMLAYFARSIPELQGYSHVHHLMRFNRLHIDTTPIVFWFETYAPEEAP